MLNDDNYEMKTAQRIVGVKNLFRGQTTKNWVDAAEKQQKKIHMLNKITVNIVLHSIQRYGGTEMKLDMNLQNIRSLHMNNIRR